MKTLFRLPLLCLVLTTEIVMAQTTAKPGRHTILDSKKVQLKEIGSLPKALREASGLALTKGHLWSHNDDGVPVLFCIDTLG